MDDILSRWCRALLDGETRVSIDLGLRLLKTGGCPLPVRLCLPGCWLRGRGLDDLEDFVDSLAWAPGTTGAERALLLVAAARLHPAALATTDALPLRPLLLAGGLGALAQGRHPGAARLLECCGPRRPGYFGDILGASLALARGAGGWPAVPAPPGPPSAALAERIARVMERRAETLARRGDPHGALGLIEGALALVTPETPRAGALATPEDPRVRELALVTPESPRAGALRLAGAELRLLLAQPAEARRLLDGAPREGLPARSLAIRLALEEDHPDEAETLARQLHEETGDGGALALQGIAVAAQERWEEAETLLRQALAAPDAEQARILHWLGVAAMMRGAPGEAEGLLRQALAARREALGAGHPEVAETTAALGTALAALGLTAEAALCYRRALVILEDTLGDEHPRTRVAATSLTELDAWQDALALERDLTTAPLDDGAFLRRLRAFSGYIALRSQEHQGLLMASRGDIERGVLLFTAPDLAEAFLASAGEALQQELTCEVLRGEDLPLLLRMQEADGVILQGAGEARGIPGKAWG